ncbi:MAG TPA: tetraacyldisaccharide 4'-kinase [Candidatus Acidoferrales bacterium]|nr:tetraacyldisaccharide 4'-kinase [Candidatus Acidoferrales bacterium]
MPGRPDFQMYFLYTLLTAIGAVLLLPWFALVRLRRGKYFHGLREKMGFFPASLRTAAEGGDGAVWIHAVSVGEVLAAIPLARRLRERFPGHRLILSTTTPAGQSLARERFAPPFLADAIFYFPLDWPFPLRRAFRAVRPSLVVIMETEIWPNFLRHARRCGIPVVFVNGRISERSFARSRRWLWLARGFFRDVLDGPRLLLMQGQADAARLQVLGANPARVEITGNLKYDITPPASNAVADWLAAASGRRSPLLVAGSVLAGEEQAVLEAFAAVRARFPAALLALAPRKPDRFNTAAELISRCGLRSLRRSAADLSLPFPTDVEVLLLDTVGELAAIYRLATLVFVGGSLISAGGHNILEPAASGKVPIFGPHMQNFRDIAEEFCAEKAALIVHDGGELGRIWLELLADEPRRTALGCKAQTLVERNQGATERTLNRLAAILQESRPHPEHSRSLLRAALLPVTPLYGLAASLRAAAYQRRILRPRRLPATVISVGNLTVGGTGKTPFVGWLAECLLRDGKRAAILSRGYRGFGRGSAPAGAQHRDSPAADEPQLLHSQLAGKVPVVEGRDRYRAAQPLLGRGVDWFVLDDGFQHLELERDVNIVLIDATDPFGGGLLPAGRAREPRSALRRADILVITRALRAPGLEAALRRHSEAPIFYAATVWDELLPISIPAVAVAARGSVSPGSSSVSAQSSAASNGRPRYFAFCGIGNPDAFFSDLRRWSGQLRGTVVGERSFPDHHRYSSEDLSEVERAARESGGTALVCTEKDARNLPLPLAATLPLFACRIRLVPTDQEAVYRAILQMASRRPGASA